MHDYSKGDSAGQTWQGRSFSANTFGSDDGSAPAQLLTVMEQFRAGQAQAPEVVATLAGVRVLIPLLAEAGDMGFTDAGLRVDKTQELSIVTVAGPDGRKVLPVFSSVAAMQHWDAKARPVPVEFQRAALAAADDGSELIVLDPGSDDTEFVVRRPAVWAVAQGFDWLPSYADREVLDAVAQVAAAEPAIQAVQLLNGDPGARFAQAETIVQLAIAQGLDQAQLGELLDRFSQKLMSQELIIDRVDSLGLKVVAGA